MQSDDTVGVVQRAFAAWSDGGLEAALELIDPEIEWIVRPDLPDAGVYRGHQELAQRHGRFSEVLDDQWFEPQTYLEAGDDRVVVPLEWGGRGKLSGIEVAEREGETWVFTVRKGRITRVREFRHKSEALEAAGLSASGSL